MNNWQFVESPGGDWYWVCTDVNSRKMRTSAATFKTRTECMADAMWYGYEQGNLIARQGAPSPRQAQAKRMPHRSRKKTAR